MMKCLINGTVEPVLFRGSYNAGILNKTCIEERHLLLHGDDFLPIFHDAAKQCTIHKALHEIAQYRNITEVESEFDLKYFMDKLEPFVLRYDSELSGKWNDEYLLKQSEFQLNHENELNLQLINYEKRYINGPIPKILLKDVTIPNPLSYNTLFSHYEKTTLWHSPNSRHKSHLHRDPGLFFVQQIYGQKKVSLIDPEFSLNVYSDFGEVYNLSPIEPTKIDISKYPEITKVEVKSTILNEGDICFLPYMYWHYIEGIPDSTNTKRNLALTFQFKSINNGCQEFSESKVKTCIRSWRNNSDIDLGGKMPNTTLFDLMSFYR